MIPTPADAHYIEGFRFVKGLADVAGPKSQITFLGDSITMGWGWEGIKLWNKYYQSRGGINLGIGGEETQHMLWRLEQGQLKNVKSKLVVLLTGTNNAKYPDSSPVEIANAIRLILDRIQADLPKAMLIRNGSFV